MIAATLFSGIGAPEVAMPQWDWPWHAEIEKFPSAVMAARHPNSINLGDVSADDFCERAARIARPNVIVFGSPCQDFSIAGKRLGLDGARGNMALTALRIVAQLEPDWFAFENVPGLLSNWSGGSACPPDAGSEVEGDENGDFAAFLGTVDELGYSGAWASLDAQYRGLAQRRDRLFFVGHIGDWRGPAAVLFEPESLCGHNPPRRQAGQNVAPTIASRPTGGGGLGTDFDLDGGLIPEISHCLNAGGMGRIDYETETLVTHALRADGFDASEDGTGRGTPLVPIAFDCKASGRNGFGVGHISPTLRSMNSTDSHQNAGGQVAVAFQSSQSGVRQVDTHATLDAHNSSRRHNGVAIGSGVRRLTPRECERLQGYEDDYTLVAYRGRPAADGPRYKALGNSMAVPIMRLILSRIEIADRLVSAGQSTSEGA